MNTTINSDKLTVSLQNSSIKSIDRAKSTNRVSIKKTNRDSYKINYLKTLEDCKDIASLSLESPKTQRTYVLTASSPKHLNLGKFGILERSKTPKGTISLRQKPNLPIPIVAISNQTNLRESTKCRLIDMLTETKTVLSLSDRAKSVSSPRKKIIHYEYYVPPAGAKLDLVLRQIKEKERVLRQETEFCNKVRGLTNKIEKNIYLNQAEIERKITNKKFKYYQGSSQKININQDSLVLPSRIFIKPRLK